MPCAAIALTATLWDTGTTTPVPLPHGRGPHAAESRTPDLATLGTAPPTGLPCAGCGQVHRYLIRMTSFGDCLPVLFPPGVPAPRNIGVEIDAHLAEPTERAAAQDGLSRYHEVAERVRHSSIRREGCGARFEDLEAYRVHRCEMHYR